MSCTPAEFTDEQNGDKRMKLTRKEDLVFKLISLPITAGRDQLRSGNKIRNDINRWLR